MASQTLTDQTVASTYQGVLHAGGEALPLAAITSIYDGSGQISSLSLGISGQGAAVAGGFSCSQQLTAGEIRYTTVDSISGANFPLVSDGNKTAVFGQMTSNALLDLSPSPLGEYNNIQYLAVNSKGLVTNVVGGPATSNAWVTFDGRDVSFTYVINNLTVTCTSVGQSLVAGNIITIKNATNTGLNGSFVVQSSDIAGNKFTFANPTGVTTGTGTGVVDVAIKSSYNVSSVVRESVGIFRINFSSAFKNKDYVAICGAKYPNVARTDLENLQANTVLAEKGFVRIRSFFITSGDQVTEYDDGYISVYCLGSAIEDNSPSPNPLPPPPVPPPPPPPPPPVSFDNFINTNYHWSEAAAPPASTITASITPNIMAANKWNMVIIGTYLSFSCRSGCEDVRSTVVVNGTTTSQMNQTTCGNSGAEVAIYHVFIYSNNELKYANFHSSNTGWNPYIRNAWDKPDRTAAMAVFNGLAAQGAAFGGQQVNATRSSPGTWATNFINSYGNQFTVIQSANVTFFTTAGRANRCDGGYAVFQNYVRYFTPQ
jgi:hypothetical protein